MSIGIFISISVPSKGKTTRDFILTASLSFDPFPPSSASLNRRYCSACVALTHPTPNVHASSRPKFGGTRKHIPGSATRKSAKPPVWLSLQPWITPAMRSPLWKEEVLGPTTVPEKSQPMILDGGSDMEACLSERVSG